MGCFGAGGSAAAPAGGTLLAGTRSAEARLPAVPSSPATAYLVGERGPELFTPGILREHLPNGGGGRESGDREPVRAAEMKVAMQTARFDPRDGTSPSGSDGLTGTYTGCGTMLGGA